MSVRLVLDIKSNQYKITKFSETHNHTGSSGEFKNTTTSRLLATNEKLVFAPDNNPIRSLEFSNFQ